MKATRSLRIRRRARKQGAAYSREAPWGFIADSPFELLDLSFEQADGIRCRSQRIEVLNFIEGEDAGNLVNAWDLSLWRHCASEGWLFEAFWEPRLSCVSAPLPRRVPEFNILTLDASNLEEPTGVDSFDARFSIRCTDRAFARELAAGRVGKWVVDSPDIVTVEVVGDSLLIATYLVHPAGLSRLLSLPTELIDRCTVGGP